MGHMMLREWLRRTPFRPFRLHISGGETYEVPSPEWMMVTPQNTAVGIPGQAGDGDVVGTDLGHRFRVFRWVEVAGAAAGGVEEDQADGHQHGKAEDDNVAGSFQTS